MSQMTCNNQETGKAGRAVHTSGKDVKISHRPQLPSIGIADPFQDRSASVLRQVRGTDRVGADTYGVMPNNWPTANDTKWISVSLGPAPQAVDAVLQCPANTPIMPPVTTGPNVQSREHDEKKQRQFGRVYVDGFQPLGDDGVTQLRAEDIKELASAVHEPHFITPGFVARAQTIEVLKRRGDTAQVAIVDRSGSKYTVTIFEKNFLECWDRIRLRLIERTIDVIHEKGVRQIVNSYLPKHELLEEHRLQRWFCLS